MVGAACPRCVQPVALHEGRPFVSTCGAIELWHPNCFAARHARAVEEVTVIAPQPRARFNPRMAFAGAGIVLAAFATVGWAHGEEAPPESLATIDREAAEPTEQLGVLAYATAQESAPPLPNLRQRHPVPLVDGTRLDELYPSLLDWIHPVTGSEEKLPDRGTALFGAVRVGVMRTECGSGHCGVDLGGPIGRPVVAVADGVVVRVERSELGRDGRSGRYVRIEHDDGALTSYMHLDEVIEGLQVGDKVDGGQQIGTLGATAVYFAPPHVHFGLEVPNEAGTHGDHTNTRYVDPAPFLVRAAVHGRADRRHALKPAL